jgi:hypothetical protein
LTPLEEAQELACDAMEATGRVRQTKARQALAISADEAARARPDVTSGV